MELGSWALISAPSILGLLPLIVFIVLALRGVENLSALIISVALGAILLGWDPGMLAQAFESSQLLTCPDRPDHDAWRWNWRSNV